MFAVAASKAEYVSFTLIINSVRHEIQSLLIQSGEKNKLQSYEFRV